jgi:hypothetical protein
MYLRSGSYNLTMRDGHVMSFSLTKDYDRVRSFGGYNIDHQTALTIMLRTIGELSL